MWEASEEPAARRRTGVVPLPVTEEQMELGLELELGLSVLSTIKTCSRPIRQPATSLSKHSFYVPFDRSIEQ